MRQSEKNNNEETERTGKVISILINGSRQTVTVAAQSCINGLLQFLNENNWYFTCDDSNTITLTLNTPDMSLCANAEKNIRKKILLLGGKLADSKNGDNESEKENVGVSRSPTP